MTTAQEIGLSLLCVLLGRLRLADIRRALRFGPAKWRQFRIARLQTQLKWDKRVHGSTYELCLYVFYEFALMVVFVAFMVAMVFLPPPKQPNRPDITPFAFMILAGWALRLYQMMWRLSNFDREIPKVEAKVERLKRRLQPGPPGTGAASGT